MKRLLVTVLACVAASTLPASAQDGTRTQVLRWEGSAHATTEAFDIKSQNWRITWSSSEAEPGTSLFQIYVYDGNGKLITLGANVRRASAAVTSMQGSGRFKLQISALKSDWVVTVEELLDPSAEEFEKVKLTVDDGAIRRQHEVILRYGSTSVSMLDKATRQPIKSMELTDIVAAEYTFAANDRRHWLVLRATENYAQLQLDRDNYRIVIAALEARTGLQVEGIR